LAKSNIAHPNISFLEALWIVVIPRLPVRQKLIIAPLHTLATDRANNRTAANPSLPAAGAETLGRHSKYGQASQRQTDSTAFARQGKFKPVDILDCRMIHSMLYAPTPWLNSGGCCRPQEDSGTTCGKLQNFTFTWRFL
jgi:hypothetical protein